MLARLLGAGQRKYTLRCFSTLVRLPRAAPKITCIMPTHLEKACLPRRWSSQMARINTESETPVRKEKSSGCEISISRGFELVVSISAVLCGVVLCLFVAAAIAACIVNAVAFLLDKAAEMFRW